MPNNERSKRKERIGVVVSDKMDKTITVKVSRVMNHPVYDKLLKRQKNFKAHDENKTAKVGDTVRIVETRPLSKTKRWRLVEVITKAATEAKG
ncbi:MAG: 30S ribosomal protein S17 [Candidatus Omnitrophota bacterium]|jgi:small subunit ribosomal protein S17